MLRAMGPLQGIRVLEFAGIGPGPFCAMLLADMGADVVRIDRASSAAGRAPVDPLLRGRRSIAVDLKQPEAIEAVLRLVAGADALVEGFRPGVMERLGLGPDVCLARNPKLVYGRMTGWGQEGPMAQAAGHDINYIALAGALEGIGRAGQPPLPPLNLVGDFGGGGMLLAFGVLAGLLEQKRSGKGQVVDAAMVDGAALLMSMFWGMRHIGMWSDVRGTNLLDTGAHFYEVYECADGKYISLGSIEPQFYAELVKLAELDPAEFPQLDRAGWPELKRKLAAVFKRKTRADWCRIMEGSDVCFAPVLTMSEAPAHPHNVARRTFIDVAGVTQPAPAPRFSRTAPEVSRPPARPGEHGEDVLASFGFSAQEIRKLRESKAIG
jgi:alpha-methylacyl-CoA racemase